MSSPIRYVLVAAACVGVVGFLTPASGWADWNVVDPYKMHYPQLPDTDVVLQTGLDVVASQQQGYGAQWKILADDWQCTATGPVSDIHIWGSWWSQLGTSPGPAAPDPNAQFKLSIHSNIAGTPSHPGPVLWSAILSPGQYVQRLWATGYLGHFWDPNPNSPGVLGNDNNVWQYNFTNLPSPLVQQAGTIYWLDVQVLSPQAEYFGWHSTNPAVTPRFMDDAVYGDTNGFNGPLLAGWTPLTYPAGHYFQGSMDLAFVITPEPSTLVLLGVIGLIGVGLWRRRPA